MAGTFRLKTFQSHTRFEGEKRDQRATYYGDGHPRAAIGGDLIKFTDEELERFPDARERFELVDGKWHDELDAIEEPEDTAPAFDDIDKLLAGRVEDIVDDLGEFDGEQLQDILKRERSGKNRKGVITAVKQELESFE